jgi:hypothetical protein
MVGAAAGHRQRTAAGRAAIKREADERADAETALQQLGVEELALGENAPGRLAQLRTDTGLKLLDCCVLLAAQDYAARIARSTRGGSPRGMRSLARAAWSYL